MIPRAVLMLVMLLAATGTATTHSRWTWYTPATLRDTTGCLDTLQTRDTVYAVVKLTVRAQDRRRKLPADLEGLFAQEFRSRLRIPKALPLGTVAGWAPCDTKARRCSGATLMFGTLAYATAVGDGTLSEISVLDVTLTPAFSDSVRSVLAAISAEKMSPYVAQKDSVPLEFILDVDQNPDTVPAERRLLRVTLPRYDRPFFFAELRKSQQFPRYPQIAERNRVEDSVVLAFTVLADGSIASQSVELKVFHYREFIQSVFDFLPEARYEPARLGTCTVASRATQTFRFKIP